MSIKVTDARSRVYDSVGNLPQGSFYFWDKSVMLVTENRTAESVVTAVDLDGGRIVKHLRSQQVEPLSEVEVIVK